MRAVDRVITALEDFAGPTSNWIVGEPCFQPPVELREALSQSAQSQTYGYPPPAGLPELREILATRVATDGRSPSLENVVVSHGAKGGLLAVFATILKPGDEIIHPQPCYPAYVTMAEVLGARPVAVPESDQGFEGWTNAVRHQISSRTRAVVIASPSNPTGSTIHSEEAHALVKMCRDRGIRLICDEAYVDFRFAEGTAKLPSAFDPDFNTVIGVRSASKSWALCGWRIGWVTADRNLSRHIAIRQASLLNPSSGPAQAALLSLPLVAKDYANSAREMVAQRHAELQDALCNRIRVSAPDGGFYLWFDIKDLAGSDDGVTSADWCCDLARRTGIGLWPGEDFSGPGRVRLAVTAPSEKEWISSLERLVTALG